MKVAIVSDEWKPEGKSFYPLIKLIEKRHETKYFPDVKSVKGDWDVIWMHSLKSKYCTKSKIPIVWMAHGNVIFNLETERTFLKEHWNELKLKELLKRIGSYLAYRRYLRIERKLLQNATLVMCYCQDNADIFIKQYPDIPKEKYFVIGYGCDYENFICK